jgi:hypothetical protein
MKSKPVISKQVNPDWLNHRLNEGPTAEDLKFLDEDDFSIKLAFKFDKVTPETSRGNGLTMQYDKKTLKPVFEYAVNVNAAFGDVDDMEGHMREESAAREKALRLYIINNTCPSPFI